MRITPILILPTIEGRLKSEHTEDAAGHRKVGRQSHLTNARTAPQQVYHPHTRRGVEMEGAMQQAPHPYDIPLLSGKLRRGVFFY